MSLAPKISQTSCYTTIDHIGELPLQAQRGGTQVSLWVLVVLDADGRYQPSSWARYELLIIVVWLVAFSRRTFAIGGHRGPPLSCRLCGFVKQVPRSVVYRSLGKSASHHV